MNIETVLIVDRDRDLAAQAAAHLAGDQRLVLTGCDAAVAGLILARMPVASIVTDVQISGPFSFEGHDLVASARRFAPSCRIFATGTDLPEYVSEEALRRGATRVLPKPVAQSVLSECVGAGNGAGAVLHIPTIEELIASDRLFPKFQPIVDLDDPDAGHGYESLARYHEAALSAFCNPHFMFQYARLRGKTADLELACIRQTLRRGQELARQQKVFVNIHPQVLASGAGLAQVLVQEAADNGIPLENVVLEITEQEKLDSSPSTIGTIEELRASGVQFALDDVGMSYSHLDLIDRIKPSYLKVSQDFGTGFERDATRKKIIRNIVALARDFDCEVIVEGVETAETAAAAEEIGARYAQGFFYSQPQVAETFIKNT